MKLYGLIMRPMSATLEENEQTMRCSEYWTETDFREKYQQHLVALDLMAESAKIYVLKNYQQVKDWSGLALEVRDRTGQTFKYYQYRDKGWNKMIKGVQRMLQKRKEQENPVICLSDAVLDPTDGDFSVTINNTRHEMVDDVSLVLLADYIEKQLKEQP
jgi:hypothetical protein